MFVRAHVQQNGRWPSRHAAPHKVQSFSLFFKVARPIESLLYTGGLVQNSVSHVLHFGRSFYRETVQISLDLFVFFCNKK
jgi:hypothetical protein